MSHKSKRHQQRQPSHNQKPEGESKLDGKPTRVHIDGGRIEADFPPELLKEYKTSSQDQKTREEKRYKIEIATLVVLGVYTLLNLLLVILTNQSIKQSQAQFREDQRPYVWQTPGPGLNRPNVEYDIPANGQRVKCGVLLQNYGKSPAITTRIVGDVEFGSDAVHQFRKFSWHDYETVLPPGKSDYLEYLSNENITADNRNIVAQGLACFFRIQYRDTSGHLYETDMCFRTQSQPIGYSGYCPAELRLNRLVDCNKEKCEH